ncbi:MAG TPA: sugar transferase, partial [bacterium]|nr:sugar transferase [bacterium]
QVHGWRGDTSIEERTAFDLYYVENWSLSLDLFILLKTGLELFEHETAY